MSGDVRFLMELARVIEGRVRERPRGSYTAMLAEKGLDHVCKKLVEEAVEVVIEALKSNKEGVIRESADLIYHLLVLLTVSGVKLTEVVSELESRRR